MIPYKWMDLTARDATGVLLSNIQRYAEFVDGSVDVEYSIFTVPAEHGFLLTSFSVEGFGGSGTQGFLSGGLYCVDAQGNPISQLFQRNFGVNLGTTATPEYGAITLSGSPLIVIGPGIEIVLSGHFSDATLDNQCFFGMNGILIPRGTMAFQS